ncbi:MAG: hypothetical protein AB7S26_11380 [Sandaracinaceae bacterium]
MPRPTLAFAALTLALGCRGEPAECADLDRFACYAEIRDGCCTTERTPNAAVCVDGVPRCPEGLLELHECAAIAGETCEANAGVPGPHGMVGVCCPVTEFLGCSPGTMPLAGGGWAPSYGECLYAIEGEGGQPYMLRYEWGCPILKTDLDAPACEAP